jgi:hypothetical protein
MLGVFDEIERNARSGVPWRPRPIKKGIRQREWMMVAGNKVTSG